MMNTRNIFITFFAAALITGCSSKTNKYTISGDRSQAQQITVTENTGAKISEKANWHSTDKKIAIVFGYGYNSPDFIKETLTRLEKKYGLADSTPESGLIFPLIYPDDFKSGGQTRITRLSAKIDNIELCGLITIGAPENTNKAIGNLQEEWANHIPYPVYTFFPQDDDIVGIEATSDFIIDKSTSADKLDEANLVEEVEQTMVKGIDAMIDNSVNYMLLTKTPLPSDKDLESHVQQIVGKKFKIKRYIDAETGLQSVNHFIID